MFVQRHPPRTCYHHHHQHQLPHPQPQHQHSAGARQAGPSGRQLAVACRRRSRTLNSASLKLISGPALSLPIPVQDLEKLPPSEVKSNFKVKSKSSNQLKPRILSLNAGTKRKRSESLPVLGASLLDLEERTVPRAPLTRPPPPPPQSTGADPERYTTTTRNRSSSLGSTEKGAAGSLSQEEPAIRNIGFVSNSLRNIWSFSYFCLDFLSYQIQTWRLIAQHTFPINKPIQPPNPSKPLIEAKCTTTTTTPTPNRPPATSASPVNEMSLSTQSDPADNLMSFNDYYLTPDEEHLMGCMSARADKTAMLDARLLRSRHPRMGARNPLYRNLSLNVDAAGPPHSYYATEYYQQRPHSSRADYPAARPATKQSPISAGYNYNHNSFYHQHFSVDSITNYNNSKPYLAEQLYSPQLARSPPRPFQTANHLSVAAGYGGSPECSMGRLHKAARRSPTTMNSHEHHSSALNNLDYTRPDDEALCSLPVTKVELCSRQPEAMGDTNNQHTYLAQLQYQQQHRQPPVRQQHQHSARPRPGMSYQRTCSEATDPYAVARHMGSADTMGGPRICSDSDLAINRFPGASKISSSSFRGGERFYHIHTAIHNRNHEKVKAAHSSGSNATTSSQPPAEPARTKSPQQSSLGSHKPNSSSLKLSLTGAKKRLGFKQSGSTALIVQRSEEILPSEPNSFLDHQLVSYSASSSTNTNHSSVFIEGLGPGQIVSRQGLVSPYLGDIQLTLTDRRGMLEVEVVRARRLQLKAGAASLPAPYVKIYLMKDKKCISKWKTSTFSRTLDPLYQELFIFREDYAHCILQVIVWGYYGKKDKKSLMGVAQIHLNDVDISNLVIGWYKLFNAPSMTNSLHSSKNLRKMLTKNLTIAD